MRCRILCRVCGGLRKLLIMLPLINVFGIIVPSYLLCAVFGFIAALFLALYRMRDDCVKWSSYYLFIVFSSVGMILGGKVLFFITVLPKVLDDFTIKKAIETFAKSGSVFYGGLFGALGFGILSARLSKEKPQALLNLFIPSFVIFHAFGRVGCFMAGCCYGIECRYGFSLLQEPGIIRFPVQLMEAVCEILILSILLYRDKKSLGKTNLAYLYLVVYAPVRFILEFLRGDIRRGFFGILSTSQWISLIIMAAIGIMHCKKHRVKNAD